MKEEAIRNAYGEALLEAGKKYENLVVLDADVSNSTKTVAFGQAYPERFINYGIAEANMVSGGAGLATMGYIPIVNTFSFLLSERALDQIRSCVAYNQLNVKIAGNYGGLSDCYDGASHHSLSDLAIIRSIPGMCLVVISDAVCMRKALEPIIRHEGPVYFRLCRAVTPIVHDEDYTFVLGKGVQLREGYDLTIVATGTLVHRALEASRQLEEEGIHVRVIEIHTLKPLDKEIILEAARETGAILTCEEATIHGGLGGAVAELVSKEHPIPMDYIGVEDCYAESGHYEELLDKYSMGTLDIIKKAKGLMAHKLSYQYNIEDGA